MILEHPEKTTGLPQVNGKSYHMKLYQAHLSVDKNPTHNLIVMSTDCLVRCKYNYQTVRGINAVGVRVMMCNVTFNNISAISWRSVLLVEETGVPGENYRPAASH